MAWLLLALSLAALAKHRLIATWLFILSVITAAFTHILTWPALIALIIFAIIAIIRWRFQKNLAIKIISEIVLICCVIGLFLHLFPGFNNLKYLDNVAVSTQSVPFTMYFNFDKALVPFILLLCLPTLFNVSPIKTAKPWQWYTLIIAIPALLTIATLSGGLGFEWYLPTWLPAFMVCNLFFVSLAEEALFRGYLQQRLTQWTKSPYLALLVTALLFGGAHYAGSLLLMLFAALAGVIYGLAWMWSGKLWLAVSFHFGLNLVHLLFFTYPVKVITG